MEYCNKKEKRNMEYLTFDYLKLYQVRVYLVFYIVLPPVLNIRPN